MFIVAGETYRGAIVILLVVIVYDRVEGEANVVEQASHRWRLPVRVGRWDLCGLNHIGSRCSMVWSG